MGKGVWTPTWNASESSLWPHDSINHVIVIEQFCKHH